MRKLIYVFALAATVNQLGCESPDDPNLADEGATGDADITVETANQAINGTINFPTGNGCSEAEKQQITAAMNTVNLWLNISPTALESCMRNVFLSSDNVYLVPVPEIETD